MILDTFVCNFLILIFMKSHSSLECLPTRSLCLPTLKNLPNQLIHNQSSAIPLSLRTPHLLSQSVSINSRPPTSALLTTAAHEALQIDCFVD